MDHSVADPTRPRTADPGAREEALERRVYDSREAVCLVALRGGADVETAGRAFEVTPERGVWLPQGSHFSVRERPGSSVLPIMQEQLRRSDVLNTMREVDTSQTPTSGLLRAFQHSLGHFDETKDPPSEIAHALIERHDPALQRALRAAPPAPTRGVASEVAQQIETGAFWRLDIRAWSERTRVSERTIQRSFAQETGLSFSQWRSAARVAAGIAVIRSERTLAGVAGRVGFSSHSSFSRACRERAGIAPRSILELVLRAPEPGPLPLPATAAPSPPWSTGQRKNAIPGLVWLAHGSGRVTVAGVAHDLGTGDVAWIPAGRTFRIDLADRSAILPYYWGSGSQAPHQISIEHFASSPDERLRTVCDRFVWPRVAATRPDTAWGRSSQQQRAARPAAQRAAESVLEWVTRHPSDARTIASWAAELGLPASALRAAFFTLTGLPFPRWRATRRMVVARRMLRSGMPPAEAAGALGYAHPAGFSRAFAAAHGRTPSEFGRGFSG